MVLALYWVMIVRSRRDPESVLPTYIGAVLGSLAAGAAWSWLYGLEGSSLAALLLAHSALGLALGWYLALADRRPTLGFTIGLGASLALTGVTPMLIGWFTPSAAHTASARELAGVEQREAPAQRVAIIGLDGGDWSVIDPMIAAGELPNLAALLSRGRGAVLR